MPRDPLVRRVGLAAAVVCLASALAAGLIVGNVRMAWGVLGGGVLTAISFVTLGSGVGALVAAAAASGGEPGHQGARGTPPGKTLAKLVLRYALLGFLAYVMIARLRLHPIGLMVGATSISAAVFLEAVRLHSKRS